MSIPSPTEHDLALRALLERVEEATGMSLSGMSTQSVREWMRRWMNEAGTSDPRRVLEAWDNGSADDPLHQRVMESLLVNETYFYRFAPQLDALARGWLKARVHETGSLDAWSAGCSTGQEALTIAAMARLAGAQPSNVRVVGTDLSTANLRVAASAVYPSHSVHGLPRELRKLLIDHDTSEDRVTVRTEIRRLVTFQRADLSKQGLGHQVDLVVCRNVLLYYDEKRRRQMVSRLVEALRPGGALLLGHGDILPESPDSWNLRRGDGPAMFFKQPPTAHRSEPRTRADPSHATPVSPAVPSHQPTTVRVRSAAPATSSQYIDQDKPVTVHLRGVYDSTNDTEAYKQLRQALSEAIDSSVDVIVNADEAESLDPGTGRLLARAARSIDQDGRKLVVVTDRESIRRWASRHGLSTSKKECERDGHG